MSNVITYVTNLVIGPPRRLTFIPPSGRRVSTNETISFNGHLDTFLSVTEAAQLEVMRLEEQTGKIRVWYDGGGRRFANLADPTGAQDIATKAYVDGHAGSGPAGSNGSNGRSPFQGMWAAGRTYQISDITTSPGDSQLYVCINDDPASTTDPATNGFWESFRGQNGLPGSDGLNGLNGLNGLDGLPGSGGLNGVSGNELTGTITDSNPFGPGLFAPFDITNSIPASDYTAVAYLRVSNVDANNNDLAPFFNTLTSVDASQIRIKLCHPTDASKYAIYGVSFIGIGYVHTLALTFLVGGGAINLGDPIAMSAFFNGATGSSGVSGNELTGIIQGSPGPADTPGHFSLDDISNYNIAGDYSSLVYFSFYSADQYGNSLSGFTSVLQSVLPAQLFIKVCHPTDASKYAIYGVNNVLNFGSYTQLYLYFISGGGVIVPGDPVAMSAFLNGVNGSNGSNGTDGTNGTNGAPGSSGNGQTGSIDWLDQMGVPHHIAWADGFVTGGY